MALIPGTRLGPYEVIAQIGRGGMGEVYRATDTNLARQVAIKVLPEAVAADADRLARFDREAKTLASLNHPNIAAIYGLERSSGTIALVMELVEGPTLADRIAQGPIPIDEALPIAKQIAKALEAAHKQRIIHRDLKPANIKVRPDGTVKVLDFGLAKAMEPGLSQSPITTPAMTQTGMILGTAAYMSPEQARGETVDERADIWAFGCVLYEMLSGRPAFAGETIAGTIAKILVREPDWRPLRALASATILDLLRRCLQKDQQRRVQDIAGAVVEIEDAHTAPGGSRRAIVRSVVAGGIAVALTLVVGAQWYGGRSIPPVRHEPVSVVIADFQNRTNDPTFDRTLEPLLRMVLEGAGFVSAYDRTQIVRGLGVRPPEKMDELAAREIAVRQGLGVVLSGSIVRQGSDYGISVKAAHAVTGDAIARATGRASNKDDVLKVATRLMTTVRRALGDEASESAQMFAMTSLSATSLEVVRLYAAGREAGSNNKYEEARQSYSKAVELDPKFGIGYQALAGVSLNLGNQQEAEKYIKEALRHLDGMTEHERYRTRAGFYLMTGDYPQCAKEYGDLLVLYPADVAAHNNLAICEMYLRNISRAVDEIRRVVELLPNRALYRVNLALWLNYATEFQAAEREARTIQEPNVKAHLALAFSQLGQGQLSQAMATYQKLGTIDALGASFAASGLGDVATLEGRYSDAVRILEQGAAQDVASGNADRAASKFAALAYAELLRGQNRAAIAAVEKALANSNAAKIRFLAARSYVEAGETGRAHPLIASLASELETEPQAYARILEGGVALKNGDSRQAITILNEASNLLDTWIGRFDLGRAYLEAGAFTQADSEFDRCMRRQGEALSMILDDEPTYAYLAPLYYYRGRAREGLRSEGFGESYRAYLSVRGKSTEDPLVQEVRRRVGQ